MQAWAETGPRGRTYERLIPNYCCPELMHKDWGWGLEERPAGGFPSLRRQQDTDGRGQSRGIKSVGQHPMGEPWAFPWSQTAVIGRKELERNSESKVSELSIGSDAWWATPSRTKGVCNVVSDLRPAVHLAMMGAFIHFNLNNSLRGIHNGWCGEDFIQFSLPDWPEKKKRASFQQKWVRF